MARIRATAAADIPMTTVWETFFARPYTTTRLTIKNGHSHLTYRDENGLREMLASLARAFGWLVEEEVVVPGWGRIDLILREDNATPPQLVELKVDLAKPAQVRRAFQQADGYGRWWATERGEACRAYLVAAEYNNGAVGRATQAYPEVTFLPTDRFMAYLGVAGDRIDRRRMRADHRASVLRNLLSVHEYALDELARNAAPPESAVES